MNQPEQPVRSARPSRAAKLLQRLCRDTGLTLRGFWATVAAVGAVFVAAALSYALLFPNQHPGLPFLAAAAAAVIGTPLLAAGLSEVGAERGRPFTSAPPDAPGTGHARGHTSPDQPS